MSEMRVERAPARFFVSQKRNEVSELRALFRALPSEIKPENTEKRRETLKRLLAYMSLGIDVSSLFPEVVLASVTPDIIQKKLVSIYLNHYAESNPETSILVINAYQKDLLDSSPKIRGMALKALTSLRVDSVEEYSKAAILNGLNDTSTYVRNYAVIGVSKLSQGNEPEMISKLISFINDTNTSTQVLVTSLLVLNELQGGYQLSRKNIVMLFNILHQCNTFEKTVILSTLSTYVPQSDEEFLGLIDTLEPYLCTTSSSLIITTIRCILSLIKNRHHLQKCAGEDTQDWKTLPITLS
ncbi:adaptin family protein, partial [Gregarina niphandrodes]